MTKLDIEQSALGGLNAAMEGLGLHSFKLRSAAWRSDDRQLFAWIVDDSKARDPYRGRAFTIEFERSLDGSWMKKLAGRARLGNLVSESEFEALATLQRDVISSLMAPPPSHLALIPDFLRDRYLSAFDPRGQATRSDFWMRYLGSGHLERWWQAIRPLLPAVLGRVATLDPHTLYGESDVI